MKKLENTSEWSAESPIAASNLIVHFGCIVVLSGKLPLTDKQSCMHTHDVSGPSVLACRRPVRICYLGVDERYRNVTPFLSVFLI